jgi:DNA-binding transcriptional LysR family regulator
MALLRPPLEREGLACAAVGDDAVRAVLRADHPLAHRRCVRLALLADEDLILPAPAAAPAVHDRLLQACTEAGFTPTGVDHAASADSALLLAAAGRGVSLVPASMLTNHHTHGLVSLPISGRCPTIPLCLAWRDDHKPPVDLDAVLAWTRQAATAAGLTTPANPAVTSPATAKRTCP